MRSEVLLTERAERDLAKMPREDATRVVEKIRALAETGEGDIRKLHGVTPEEWRLRVGDWRVRLSLRDSRAILVLRVLPRGRAYRRR